MPPGICALLEGRIPISCHEQVAVLYRGAAGVHRLATFLAEGLQEGDYGVYLAPALHHEEMTKRLYALGTRVDRHLEDGTLVLHAGIADFARLREWAHHVFAESERLKLRGVRWLEEGSWAAAIGFPLDNFYEFHSLLNFQVKHYPSIAICQYALDGMDPYQILSAIAVHRHILIGETLVRDNPFYIPAEKFIPLSPAERERDLMKLFREFGFDIDKLLTALVGYATLGQETGQPRPG